LTGYRLYFADKYGLSINKGTLPTNYTMDDVFSGYSNPDASSINEKLIDYIINDMNSKYGKFKEDDITIAQQNNFGGIFRVKVAAKIWSKDGLEVTLRKKSLEDGFLQVAIDYDLSNDYIEKNKKYLETKIAKSSKF
jgi:hypothetical protein